MEGTKARDARQARQVSEVLFPPVLTPEGRKVFTCHHCHQLHTWPPAGVLYDDPCCGSCARPARMGR